MLTHDEVMEEFRDEYHEREWDSNPHREDLQSTALPFGHLAMCEFMRCSSRPKLTSLRVTGGRTRPVILSG